MGRGGGAGVDTGREGAGVGEEGGGYNLYQLVKMITRSARRHPVHRYSAVMFSSPEPKAHKMSLQYTSGPSSVVHTFKLKYL